MATTIRTPNQIKAALLRRNEYKGWSAQVTRRGYPSADRAEVVIEMFGPAGERKDYYVQHGR